MAASWLPSKANKKTNRIKAREESSTIAAVDFGTTFCSLAYCIDNKETVRCLEINSGEKRVPTALLLQKDCDGNCAVEEFGRTAQDTTIALSSMDHRDYHYFEFFKMQLHNEVDSVNE